MPWRLLRSREGTRACKTRDSAGSQSQNRHRALGPRPARSAARGPLFAPRPRRRGPPRARRTLTRRREQGLRTAAWQGCGRTGILAAAPARVQATETPRSPAPPRSARPRLRPAPVRPVPPRSAPCTPRPRPLARPGHAHSASARLRGAPPGPGLAAGWGRVAAAAEPGGGAASRRPGGPETPLGLALREGRGGLSRTLAVRGRGHDGLSLLLGQCGARASFCRKRPSPRPRGQLVFVELKAGNFEGPVPISLFLSVGFCFFEVSVEPSWVALCYMYSPLITYVGTSERVPAVSFYFQNQPKT